MPRLYLALARADRAPILDILARTPSLPEACQWATFLRCHDELTLEMVTPEERQFLWEYYAPEPRMRLNLGIRRRLAPLLGNAGAAGTGAGDRARIELANSLLFTLPGSPVVYYGDEIGMGDNIWLDDRDGVRTPMQWDDSPNAGFSTAEPNDLYAPLIADGTYGYQQVNVAAQRRDPGSLLHKMRQMIHVRKAHPAFGRGELEFLAVPNRSVLAYLRTHGDETILVVNNLSAAPQTASLDLKSWAESRPEDLFGVQTLPPCSPEPFILNLQRYEYLWLKL